MVDWFKDYREYKIGDMVGIWGMGNHEYRTIGKVVHVFKLEDTVVPLYVIEFENHIDATYEVRSGSPLEMQPEHLCEKRPRFSKCPICEGEDTTCNYEVVEL